MSVTVILLILIDMTFAQRFCDTYGKNDYNIVVHSPDDQNLLFAVNDLSNTGFYWTLIETDSRLQFKRSDTLADYHSSAFSDISTMFSIGGSIEIAVGRADETQIIYRFIGYLEVSLRLRLYFLI